jgi:hypothetical protein
MFLFQVRLGISGGILRSPIPSLAKASTISHLNPLHKIKNANCYKSLACDTYQYSTQVGADILAWIYQHHALIYQRGYINTCVGYLIRQGITPLIGSGA